MGNSIADWFIRMRNIRAWFTAGGLLVLLLWALQAMDIERVEYRELTGELISVTATGKATDGSLPRAVVRLPDGTRVSLILPTHPPHPQAGDRVPIIFERYDDGKVIYAFDNRRWITDGGIPQ